jgi:hypothetical protein
MPVHFLTDALPKWDKDTSHALVLTFFSDERPLRGAAGLADWRLCGRLSRLIKQGKISGRRGEILMLPPGKRMTFPRVLLFGLGNSARFDDEQFRQHVRWIRDVVNRARIDEYALQPPGRATGLIAARRALELWLDEEAKDARETNVAIIDRPGAHKEMAEVLRTVSGRMASRPAADVDDRRERDTTGLAVGGSEPEPGVN